MWVNKTNFVASLVGLAGIALSTSAAADESWTWVFTTGSGSTVDYQVGTGSYDYGPDTNPMTETSATYTRPSPSPVDGQPHRRTLDSTPASSSSLQVDAMGWAATKTVGAGNSNNVLYYDGLADYGSNGMGLENRDETEGSGKRQHAFDNLGRYELVMFDFGESIALHEITLGYYHTDSDISLLAYRRT